MIEALGSGTHAARTRWISFIGAAWLLALYFMCRPYRGVRHDAQIYFGQLQLRLSPEWMSHDLFFQHGSQDRYTIFSAVFAPVLRAFGMVQGEIGSLLLLHALFWLAAWAFVRRVEPAATRWVMLAVVALMPHFYGGAVTFSFQEPFLTARTLAEPSCIFALAALARGRLGWALAGLVLALVSHPLIAIPAWALAWYLLCERDRRWLWAGLVLVLPLVAGWLGVAPFDGLFRRYDAAWYTHVLDSNSFNFVQTWQRQTWALTGFDLAFLAILSLDADMPLRRFYRAAVVVGVGMLLLSALLVDGLHLVLPTQLQLWRAMWIVHLLALLGLYPGLMMLWRRGPAGHLAAAAVALAAVIVNAQAQTGFVFAAAAILIAALAMRRPTLDRRIAVVGIVSCIVGAAVMGLIQAIELALILLQGINTGMPAARLVSIPSAIPQLMLAATWLVLVGAARSRRGWALPASAACALIALAWSVTAWDQRDDWARYVESHYGQPSPFGDVLRLGAQVYWPGEMLANWVLLRRPNYIAIGDDAAAVFNRESTIELDRRKAIVLPMKVQTDACVKLALAGRANYDIDQCKYTDLAIHDVCRAPGAPDNVVLMNPLQARPLAVWNYQPPHGRPEPYYLYDCHGF